ncbi:hypothetical protein EXN66_Car001122 [Channa argus]|uniref:Uncharacterized protein n=1 Tax=Channa argus TaxID=215402 RepID=A0A6G1R084_CHAAH|nr:hypothetical protein EXN66_Car001122 [Channa argus]
MKSQTHKHTHSHLETPSEMGELCRRMIPLICLCFGPDQLPVSNCSSSELQDSSQ